VHYVALLREDRHLAFRPHTLLLWVHHCNTKRGNRNAHGGNAGILGGDHNVQGYTSVIMFSPAHGQYIHITRRRSLGPILQNVREET
jgi:hypothetical protein